MMKVLIADDEEKVCQLIYNLIDWPAKDMEVTGFAHNGVEALALIEQSRPDIIITDIRMPGYDGLELIQRAKALKRDLQFIIISGYRHFEYARSAIKFGVEDYLLKPVNENELNETLDKLRHRKQSESEQISREKQLQQQAHQDEKTLRELLLTEVIQHQEDGRSLDEINRDYHYHMEPELFLVFIVKVDCAYGQELGEGIRVLKDKIQQIIINMLREFSIEIQVFSGNQRVICLLNYREEHKKDVRRRIKGILDELMVQRNIFGDIGFSIGCSSPVTAAQLHQAWQQATLAIDERLIEGQGRVLEAPVSADCERAMNECLAGFNIELEKAMEVLNYDQVSQVVTKVGRSMRSIEGLTGSELRQGVEEAWHIYRMLLRKYQLRKEGTDKPDGEFSNALENCGTATAALRFLQDEINRSMKQLLEERQQLSTRPIREAMQYIRTNYNKSLSLDEVSRIAGFNPTYFSTLFKKETGKNFQEYILELRMNQAKELLKETDHPVASICEEVGYTDVRHFTKTFKKYAGINPNQYRKIYS